LVMTESKEQHRDMSFPNPGHMVPLSSVTPHFLMDFNLEILTLVKLPVGKNYE
jgi:hypothetical protein